MRRLYAFLPAFSIFLLALAVRVVYNLTTSRGYIPEFDAITYNNLAKIILHDHSILNIGTGRAPLWPLIIALIYALTGPNNLYPRLFFAFLGSGTCVLTYFFARDLFGKRAGIIAGALAAIYTGLFIYDGWLYTESLYTFLVTAFGYSLYRLQQTFAWRWALLNGIALALATYTRPNGVLFFALVVVWAIIIWRAQVRPWRIIMTRVLLLMLVAALLIAPWTYRNYQQTHTFMIMASGSGIVLSGSYNDTALLPGDSGPGLWIPPHLVSPRVELHGHSCCDYISEPDNINYALHWIGTHPQIMPYLLGLHFYNMWRPYTSEDGLPMIEHPTLLSSQIVWDMMQIMPIPIFLLAFLGLLLTWRRKKVILLVSYLIIALTILQNVAFYGSSRFRAPIEPMLVILVAGVGWWLLEKEVGTLFAWRKRRKEASVAALVMDSHAASPREKQRTMQKPSI